MSLETEASLETSVLRQEARMKKGPLTFSSIQINTDTFANSADPDEAALQEPSHLDLHDCYYVIDFGLKPLFAKMYVSKFRDGRVHVRNLGYERVNLYHGTYSADDKRRIFSLFFFFRK